jgi:DMSO/TMAO reductase YedYZ molybdopterin-dependent catalytic subunit
MLCRRGMLSLLCFCALPLLAQSGPATLTVFGDIPAKLILTAEDLSKMPRVTVSIPDQDGTKVEYEGVSLREILKRAGTPTDKARRGDALASYVLATASDGYKVAFTLAEVAPEFANESVVVADKRDGKPLFGYQGPFRLVCPNDKAGARSVRMLATIEFVLLRK